MARLSQLYNLRPQLLDFVDVEFGDDLPLYVDPLLFWRSPHREHHAVHGYLIHFFEDAIAAVKSGQLELAKRMMDFPEPENLIGLSRSGHHGHGMGDGPDSLGRRVYDELIANHDIQDHGLTFLNELQFMIDKIGPDLISDMSVNIAKRYFVHYTNVECTRWHIPLYPSVTRFFLKAEGVWDDRRVLLPLHSEARTSFLLTPKAVVRRFVRLGAKEVYNDVLRDIYREQVEGRQWDGLGKRPRLTWKEVSEEFPFSKGLVTRELRRRPDLRRVFTRNLKRDTSGFAREMVASRLDLGDERLSVVALQEIAAQLGRTADVPDANAILSASTSSRPPSAEALLEQLQKVVARSGKELVVVLGAYSASTMPFFDNTTTWLGTHDYVSCVLRDMPDGEGKAPRQKLFTYACLARFIVVLDLVASGHLNEIELLKDLGIPIAVLSSTEQGTTFMLHGLSGTNTFIERFQIVPGNTIDETLAKAIDWAEDLRASNVADNRESLPWLRDEIDEP
jgi:hypothetical protein